jgi:hypothetical protein
MSCTPDDVRRAIAEALEQQRLVNEAARAEAFEQYEAARAADRVAHHQSLEVLQGAFLHAISLSQQGSSATSAAPVPGSISAAPPTSNKSYVDPRDYKAELKALLTFLPEETDNKPSVFDLYGEQHHQHLVARGRELSAEEYRFIYCVSLYQRAATQALTQIIGPDLLDESSDDFQLLSPVINSFQEVSSLLRHRLGLLRLRAGARGDTDPNIIDSLVHDTYDKPSDLTDDPTIQAVIQKHRDSVAAAIVREASKVAAQGRLAEHRQGGSSRQRPGSRQQQQQQAAQQPSQRPQGQQQQQLPSSQPQQQSQRRQQQRRQSTGDRGPSSGGSQPEPASPSTQ